MELAMKNKEEELEEASWRFNPLKKLDGEFLRTAFIKGAKWQQERSYSEEEVFEIIALFVNDAPHNTKEWFEQFKKK